MTPNLTNTIEKSLESVALIYHRLVLIVGPRRSGKTSALEALAAKHDWPLLQVSRLLAPLLLELTVKQRRLKVSVLLADLLLEHEGDTLLLDDIELLFHPDLELDPLSLLQHMSRNRTLIVAWQGEASERLLTYAEPRHPEWQSNEDPDALIFRTSSTTSILGQDASSRSPRA